MKTAAVAVLVMLAACGKQGELMRKAPPGETPKLDPSQPLPSVLLKPPPEAQPSRADDPLRRSEDRRDDPFSLPPQ